ncbi:MAG: winged helix-turn-helix transcriptional regulator [Reyranella sp.]|jgi:DNA-binding MarR family transcriptional regulator|nr:winged helix-turn-helix transcriptional regulator [Reyranella sp.]
MTETSLAFRIVNWIGIISQLTTTEGNRALKPLGLTLPHFIILNHFSHRPNEAKTVTSIARALQQPQPGVTKTVQKLVAKGWLRERANGTDGRSKLLVLAPSGLAKHRAAVTALTPGVERAFAGWPEKDRHTLFAMLDRLKVWFDQERDPTQR